MKDSKRRVQEEVADIRFVLIMPIPTILIICVYWHDRAEYAVLL
jgi:hypothetical protein